MLHVPRWVARIGLTFLALTITACLLLFWAYQKPEHFLGFFTNPTPTAAEQGLYVGKDAGDGKAVTWANWMQGPYNRLSFRHLSDFLNTVPVSQGDSAASTLEHAPPVLVKQLEQLELPNGLSLDEALEGTNADGFIALKDGKVLVEKYYNGQTPESRHIMMSVTKSFTGIIGEMMILEGLLDESDLIGSVIPELEGSAFADATLRNLLDMEVSTVFDETYSDPNSDISRFIYSSGLLPWPDGHEEFVSLYDFLSSLQKKEAHGREFQYTTATTEVLGWVIAKQGGRSFEKLFEELLYQKIGAERDAYFAADTRYTAVAGGGLSITLRDMARLALVISNQGYWNGQQIVPRQIIEKIKAGGDPSHFPDFLGETGSYKSQWYVDAPNNTLRAMGINGQQVFIDFDSDVVIVQQSSNPDAGGLFILLCHAVQNAFAETYLVP
jgi:CubicO group peptidase (beta-lactamase class C family)